jgi:hypothetical protein
VDYFCNFLNLPKVNNRPKNIWRNFGESGHSAPQQQEGETEIKKEITSVNVSRVARFVLVHDTKTGKNVPN